MVLAVSFSLFLAATPAEQVAQAARALDALDYEGALAALPKPEAAAGFTQEQVLALFSTRALALVSLKREEEAAEAFRQLFAVAPEWKLPEQYGPRIRTLAGMAAAEAEEKGTLAVSPEGGALKVGKDSYGYATAFELTWRVDGGGPTTRSFPVGVTLPAPWPAGRPIEAYGRFLGLAGSTLATWGHAQEPIRFGPSPLVTTPRPAFQLRPLTVAGLAAGVAALAAGGAGLAFASGSTEAQRALASAQRDADGRITSLTQREAFLVEQRSASAATLSGVFFVTAGVLAAGSAGLLVLDRVRATPGPGGVTFSVPLDATFGLAASGVAP